MIRPPARAGLLVAALALSGAACGDDANDRALQAQLLADRLDAERAAAATAPGVDDASAAQQLDEASASRHDDVSPTQADRAAAPATTSVPRTGVVVPVIALDNSFRPQTVEAKVGDEVVWENRGRNEHDVLSIEGTLADGTAWGVTVDDFQPGDIYAHVFTEPGEYRYYCTIHGSSEVGMIGTVVVTA